MRPALLSIVDAATYLGVAKSTLTRMVARGEIAYVRTHDGTHERRPPVPGGAPVRYRKTGRLLFEPADLDRWIARHRVPPVSDESARAGGAQDLSADMPLVRRFA